MRFYTWKDIERYILMHHDEWKDELYDIEVYPNEMVVYPKSEQGTLQNAVLKKLFPKNIAPDNLSIKLDGQGEDLMILYEYEYSPVTVRTLPLFKKAIYEDSIYPTEQLADLSCPVFAFHSYKGGVGRTLSLIAFARAWTNLQKNPENSKLLIIDSDLEAPGLTLIQGDLNDSAFSYLDLLTLIQDNSNVEEIVSTAGNLMGTITLPIETSQQRVEHFFLPTYRCLICMQVRKQSLPVEIKNIFWQKYFQNWQVVWGQQQFWWIFVRGSANIQHHCCLIRE